MGVLNAAQGSIQSFNNKINDALSLEVSLGTGINENDFKDGFIIEEYDMKQSLLSKLPLKGNMMPKIPFKFGGSQRVKKDFYSGSSEPVVQVLGSEEDDITINGKFKEKRFRDSKLDGISVQLQEEVDRIRKSGNVIKITLGEFKRYCYISKTSFSMSRLREIEYEITFSIIGEFFPTNARFLQNTKELPTKLSSDLLTLLDEAQSKSSIPATVPLSISELINGFVSDIAGVMSAITGMIDGLIATYNNIQKSITRIVGLIKYAQNKLRAYKNFIGSLDPFNQTQALTGKYQNTKFYRKQMALSSSMTSLLERIKKQISNLATSSIIPLGRYIVKDGDTLQKISIKYFNDPSKWFKIMQFNNLKNENLVSGVILEIPRL